MRSLLFLAFAAFAADEKPPPLPKKAAEQLKEIAKKLDEAPGDVRGRNGEFANTKIVASEVDFVPIKSQWAGKPIAAELRWTGTWQYSKFYPTKEAAQKADEWLKPGKAPGAGNAHTKPLKCWATYYYVQDKWELDEIAWNTTSTTRGAETPWTTALGIPARAKKKE